VGENIGDLGGVAIAYRAYVMSLGGDVDAAPVMDGMTGAQRFFVGWAQCWRALVREAEAVRRLSIDPHSPSEFRANVVRNLTEFYAAFDVASGDGLWLEPEQRVRIW
jgi:putative endopeptidase